MTRHPLHWIFCLGALASLSCASRPGHGQDASPIAEPTPVDRLLAELGALEMLPFEEIWSPLEALRRDCRIRKPDPLPELRPRLPELHGAPRLGAAFLLFERSGALERDGRFALLRLAGAEEERDEARIAAIRLLGRSDENSAELRLGLGSVHQAGNERIRVEVAAALLRLAADAAPTDAMYPTLRESIDSSDPRVRESAALALAELGDFRPEVTKVLLRLRRVPTADGRLAAALYERFRDAQNGGEVLDAGRLRQQVEELQERIPELERTIRQLRTSADLAGPDREGWIATVAEVLERIHERSLYAGELNDGELIAAALKAIASAVDDYSLFLDPDAVARLRGQQREAYSGIGAQLMKVEPRGFAIVARAYAGGPAFESGLRTGDRILEVNGVRTSDLSLSEIREITARRQPNIEVVASSWYSGENRTLTIEHAPVGTPGLYHQVFPGNLAYIRVSRFRPKTAAELEAALAQLQRGADAGDRPAGILLDLRDNSGGLLDQAAQVVDLFVSEEARPIVSLRSARGQVIRSYKAKPARSTDLPLVVLVSRFTASAAEVVAGALQDFGRATLVGERTFGKGVEQRSSVLRGASALLGGESRLLLTEHQLFLPSGRPLQPRPRRRQEVGIRNQGDLRSGVAPDIEVHDVEEGFLEGSLPELRRVMFSSATYDYLSAHREAIRRALDAGNIWSPTPYPDLERLHARLGTTLSTTKVTVALRRLLRRRLAEANGLNFASDYAADRQLQVGIARLLKAVGVDPESIPEYSGGPR